MTSSPWFVIGVSGISCSGKTTLATAMREHFSNASVQSLLLRDKCIRIGQVKLIQQDDYFYPIDSPHHIWIPHLNHINREHLGALDNERMCNDLDEILGKNYVAYQTNDPEPQNINILIIEGYLIFNHIDINKLFTMRFCMQISFEDCLARRARRVYPQPTPKGYFEQYVWPIYQKHFSEYQHNANLKIINGGTCTREECANQALECINKFL